MTAALLPLALLAAQAASAADSTRPLRYDLRPGDHLVYRQVLEEELDGRTLYGLPGRQERTFGPAVQATRHAEWTRPPSDGVRAHGLRHSVRAEPSVHLEVTRSLGRCLARDKYV